MIRSLFVRARMVLNGIGTTSQQIRDRLATVGARVRQSDLGMAVRSIVEVPTLALGIGALVLDCLAPAIGAMPASAVLRLPKA